MFQKNRITSTSVLLSAYCKSLLSTADLGTSYHKKKNVSSDSSDAPNLKIFHTDSDKKPACSAYPLKKKIVLSEDLKENVHCNLSVNTSFPSEQEDDNSTNAITNKKLINSSSPTEPHVSSPPEPPIYCCGTGCPNCSWIIYAEELKNYYKNGIDKSKLSAELDKIKDPSVRMFVKLELGL